MSTPANPPTNDSPRARVMRNLRQWVAEGRYRHEAMPSERNLAEHFGVGRGTVRSALRDLHEQGVLTLKGYKRTVAPPGTGGGLMGRTIALLTSYLQLESVPQVIGPARGSLTHISASALLEINRLGYNGLTVCIGQLDQDATSELTARPPAGLLASDDVVTTGRALPLIEQLLEAGVPCVTFDEVQSLPAHVDRVLPDHEAGAAALCETLFQRGFKRILRVWVKDKANLPWVAARDRGYERAHQAAGITPIPPVFHDPDGQPARDQASFERRSRHMVATLIEHLVGDGAVDALMLMTDGHATYAAQACKLCKLVPNRDVAIVGYDAYCAQTPEFPFCPIPPLATIDKRNDRIGAVMAQLLIDRIQGDRQGDPVTTMVPGELIINDLTTT